jgi:hypothetical protein
VPDEISGSNPEYLALQRLARKNHALLERSANGAQQSVDNGRVATPVTGRDAKVVTRGYLRKSMLALLEGIAPPIRGQFAEAIKPLLLRIRELEARLSELEARPQFGRPSIGALDDGRQQSFPWHRSHNSL